MKKRLGCRDDSASSCIGEKSQMPEADLNVVAHGKVGKHAGLV